MEPITLFLSNVQYTYIVLAKEGASLVGICVSQPPLRLGTERPWYRVVCASVLLTFGRLAADSHKRFENCAWQ